MNKAVSIEVRQEEEGFMLAVVVDGEQWVQVRRPFNACLLGLPPKEGHYTSVEQEAGKWVAVGSVESPDGTELEIRDVWHCPDGATVQVDREVTTLRSGQSQGVRVEFRAETAFQGTSSLDDFEFFIPGSLYKKNDTDHDGIEDYLGTFTQDYRDDRLASLAVLAYLHGDRRFVALTRATPPQYDTAISGEDILSRHFVQNTDIGSLGLAPIEAPSTQIALRASYPFSEEYTYCLNTNRDGWAAYLENREGQVASVSYQLRIGTADTLTDAIWEITRHQMARLGTMPQKPGFSLEDSLDYRMTLTQLYYQKWDQTENPKEPAGYMVHFSPRSGKTLGTLLEYGFAGAQTLLAYDSIKYGYMKQIPLYVERARTVIDFFVKHCQLENGFPHGIYDVAKQDFVYWFTGILLPFHHAEDEASLKRQIGSQMAQALLPIAKELRAVKGNYTRTMSESIYPILLAYQAEKVQGITHEDWLGAAERFGAFLLSTQGADGSWHRAYDESGKGLERPAQWFGASDTEKKSGTIFPVEVLVELYKVTNDKRYLSAAEKAGHFMIQTFVDPVEYVGGLNDTTHIKSVKTDAVGVMFVMRSLIKLYEVTRQSEFLDGAVNSARILASWVYLWNVPFPEKTLLGDSGFKSTGWAGCDVIPSGSYLDDEFLEFTGDFIKVAQFSGDEALFDIAEIVEYGMQHALSTPHNMLGYAAPGIQCEGIMTAYWMSDPEVTEFSGAANKVKGQDNDTCNGLINAQAAYGIFDLLETHGTIDFDEIRHKIFER